MARPTESVRKPDASAEDNDVDKEKTHTEQPRPDASIPLPPENKFPQGYRPERREMSLKVEDAMKLLCRLCRMKDMKAVHKDPKKFIAFTSTMAMVGGLVWGPLGLAVGSTVGGLLGALVWIKKFKPVSFILKKLPQAEQEKLCSQVSDIIEDLEWTDTKHLTKLVMGNKALQKQLLKLIEDYLTKELGFIVQYGD